jgi:hypothetical protein
LLDKLVGKRRTRPGAAPGAGSAAAQAERSEREREADALAIGYEVLEGAERDEGELECESSAKPNRSSRGSKLSSGE